MREGRRVVVWAPDLDKLQVFIELEQLRSRSAPRTAAHACARINKEVALRVLGHPFRFADRVAGDRKRQHFLLDLQLRSRRLQFKLLFLPRLRLRVVGAALALDPQRPRSHRGAKDEQRKHY